MSPTDDEVCSFMLTEREVAEYFRVSIHTVRSWRYGGKLDFIKVGNHVRIESEEVLRFINEHRVRVHHKPFAVSA